MTRLLVVSDLHFPNNAKALWRLTVLLRRISIDALVLAGDFLDSVSADTVRKLFRLLRSVYRVYRGYILVVWGNHEHYLTWNRLRKGWNSLGQLNWLQGLLEEYGVTVLDSAAPVSIRGVNIVGVVGWYDYSYGPSIYTVEDYERCNPYGVPLSILQSCERGRWSPLCPKWWRNDCIYVKLPMTYQQYARLKAEKLRKQLEEAEPPVVAVLHHVPKRELLSYTGNHEEDFDLAYAGSPLLGKTLEEHQDEIVAVAYGHVHERSRTKTMYINGIPYINTYYSTSTNPGYALIEIEKVIDRFRARITVIE